MTGVLELVFTIEHSNGRSDRTLSKDKPAAQLNISLREEKGGTNKYHCLPVFIRETIMTQTSILMKE